MTGKQQTLLDELLDQLPDEDHSVCQRPVSMLLDIGYVPSRRKGAVPSIDFKYPAHKKRIANIAVIHGDEPMHFSLQFSALDAYPPKFAAAIEKLVDTHSDTYLVCSDCCLCSEKPHPYRYTRPSGEAALRCGVYLHAIESITSDGLADIETALSIQHAALMASCVTSPN